MELPKELAASWTFSYGSSLPFQSDSCAGASGSIRNQAALGRAADTQGSEVASHLLVRNNLTDHRQGRVSLPNATASSQKQCDCFASDKKKPVSQNNLRRLFTMPGQKGRALRNSWQQNSTGRNFSSLQRFRPR
jgi:hypothetical protein